MLMETQISFMDYWNNDIVFSVDALEENGLAICQDVSYYMGQISLGKYQVIHVESGIIHKSNLGINKAKKYVKLFNTGLTDKTTLTFVDDRWIASPEYWNLFSSIDVG